MSSVRIEFDHLDDDLDLLPPAEFRRINKSQRRFDDNVNRKLNEKKRSRQRHKERVDWERD